MYFTILLGCKYSSIYIYITYSEKDSEKVSSAKVCHPLNLTTSKRLRYNICTYPMSGLKNSSNNISDVMNEPEKNM